MFQRFSLCLLGVTFVACGTGTAASDLTGAADASVSEPEMCDELDDDADGQVDEDCTCTSGSEQACWPGEASERGQGMCADGTQSCDGAGAWGACEGATLATPEIQALCTNGLDDDCDSLVDCDDEDCEVFTACCATLCVEGTQRVCNSGGKWGMQACGADQRWSACALASPPTGCGNFPTFASYDQTCCVSNGHCCEHANNHQSVGACPPEENTCGD